MDTLLHENYENFFKKIYNKLPLSTLSEPLPKLIYNKTKESIEKEQKILEIHNKIYFRNT